MTSQTAVDIRTRPQPACLLCGRAGESLYEKLADRFYGAPGEWSFKRCLAPACGLIWLDPMPVEEDLARAYANYFTHGDDHTSALWLLCYAAYRAANALPSLVTGLAAEKRRMESLYLNGSPPGRLLDVGCGDGGFLDKMTKSGWTGEGVDFDATAVERARSKFGLTAHVGDLASRGYADGHFDAVTARHVIEHVPDPVGLLRECRRVLKPGGRLVFVTPNTESWGHARFREAWMNLDPPRHLHLFSLRNLRECARRAGFEQIDVRSTAANAETVFTVSLAVEARGKHQMGAAARPEILRPLKAVWLQYRELSLLTTNPAAGEEAVLLCVK